MKLLTLINTYRTLGEFAPLDTQRKLAYAIVKNRKLLEDGTTYFDDEYKKLMEKYRITVPDKSQPKQKGNEKDDEEDYYPTKQIIDPKYQTDADKEYKELMDSDFEIKGDLWQLDLALFDKTETKKEVVITPGQMEVLMTAGLIKEDTV